MFYKESWLKEFMKGVTDEYNWHVESIFFLNIIIVHTNEIRFKMYMINMTSVMCITTSFKLHEP